MVFADTGALVSLCSFVLFTGNDLYIQDSGSPTFDRTGSLRNYLSIQWCSEKDFLVSILERLFALCFGFFPHDL